MPQFSLLVRLHAPVRARLKQLLDSLEDQSLEDWDLSLLVEEGNLEDERLAWELIAQRSQVRMIQRPVGELAAWSVNALLPMLGDWVGILEQDDWLPPEALETFAAALLGQDRVQVVYSDECHRDRWGWQSLHRSKGPVDRIRLLTQEHLGNLAFVRRTALQSAGGFDRLASDVPAHDLYLRLLEGHGEAGFLHVPGYWVQHWRDYLESTLDAVPRRRLHVTNSDRYAVRQALARRQVTATVRQERDVLQLDLQPGTRPPVAAWIFVDDSEAGVERLHAFNRTQSYRPLDVRVLHLGSNGGLELEYRMLCKALGYRYERHLTGSVPVVANRLLPREDATWVLLLQGAPLNFQWLDRLVELTRLSPLAAVGARTMDPVRLSQPGTLGYAYDGRDWNTRGRFSQLVVPHRVSALGAEALLFNPRIVRELGGFDEAFPRLCGMDLSLRLGAAGHQLALVPRSQVLVDPGQVPDEAERHEFLTRWAGWKDPFSLHQLPE